VPPPTLTFLHPRPPPPAPPALQQVLQLEDQLSTLQTHYQEKQTEMAALQRGNLTSSAASQREEADAAAQLTIVQADRDALQQQVAAMSQQLERSIARQQEAEASRAQAEDAARQQVKAAESAMERYREQLARAEARCADLQRRISTAEQHIEVRAHGIPCAGSCRTGGSAAGERGGGGGPGGGPPGGPPRGGGGFGPLEGWEAAVLVATAVGQGAAQQLPGSARAEGGKGGGRSWPPAGAGDCSDLLL